MRRKQSRRQCIKCKHFLGGMSCKAFPSRIPLSIYAGIETHTNVIPEQTGDFVYSPLDNFEESDMMQIAEDNSLIDRYEENKKKLAELLLRELSERRLSHRTDDGLRFVGKITSGGTSTLDLFSLPSGKRSDLNKEKFHPGSDIYSVFRDLAIAERIINGVFSSLNLTVYRDGSYLYTLSPVG